MALLSRVYFNAVYGALGGLLGWLFFGVFGNKNPGTDYVSLTMSGYSAFLSGASIGGPMGALISAVVMKVRNRSAGFSQMANGAAWGAVGGSILCGLIGWLLFGNKDTNTVFMFLTEEDLNALLGGAVIGGLIGYFVVAVDAIRDQSTVRFARLATYGVGLGALGGSVGMWIGDVVNFHLQQAVGGTAVGPVMALLARGLGWSLLGIAIGASEGIAARSLGKFSYGMIGGALGGFIGGVIVQLFYEVAKRSLGSTYFWSALGLVILGACIGALSAMVQAMFQPACVRVLRGWQEGREYPLDKDSNSLGRAEDMDIALFRDMKVEKKHAYIRRQGEQYVLVNNGAPAGNTLVNEAPVPTTRPLNEGDRIQLGDVILRFHMRQAASRKKKVILTPTKIARR